MTPLLPLETALDRLAGIGRPVLETEEVALAHATGRVLAADFSAPIDLPLFPNSAVDGFALRSADAQPGVTLRVLGTAWAGTPFTGRLEPGTAVRVATGGVLPDGADAAAMLEDCADDGDRVTLRKGVSPGGNCRRAGQDVRAGTVVLPGGTRLSASSLAMVAALGRGTVVVRRRLRVAIASTGSELIEAGTPASGEIYDCNRTLLRSLLLPYAVEVTDLGILPDDPEATRRVLGDAARVADLVVTSGGVSVGARDYVRELVEAGDMLFSRLAIKPGRPVLCGRLDGTPLLGLPGNPVSAFVTFQLLCRALLRHLAGMPPGRTLSYPVRMGSAYRKPAHLREFIRVTLEPGGPELRAHPFRSQLSNLVSSLTDSDGVADLPPGRDVIEAGEPVAFTPWTGFDA